MNNTLVVYFSASGRTKRISEELAASLNADLYEIKPKETYTSEDLNWMNKESRSSIEMKNLTFRPEIIKEDLDLTKYSKIVLGFPIWWGIAPTVVNTFLESYDFTNKTVYPFATSGGSGYGKSNDLLKESLGSNVTLKEGKLVSNVTEELTLWIKE